jgi:hypothetical protein
LHCKQYSVGSTTKVIELTRPARATPPIVAKAVNLAEAVQFGALFFKAVNARHLAQQCSRMRAIERVYE